jgi:hypothetical protein
MRGWVLAVIVASAVSTVPSAAAGPIPGLWVVDAVWAPAPGEGHLLALRVQTLVEPTGLLGFGTIGVTLPGGLEVQDLTALSYDVYVEAGGCGGGSPRGQLAVDTDGDGASDGNVHVYGGPPGNFGPCPAGTWLSHNLLDGAARFDSTQFGGPFFGTQAQTQAVLGDGNEVLTATLVWDSTWLFGPSVMWFDNVQVQCLKLGEPLDLVLSIVNGVSGCLLD